MLILDRLVPSLSILSATSLLNAQRTLFGVSTGEGALVMLTDLSLRGERETCRSDLLLSADRGVPPGDCEDGISLLIGFEGVLGGGMGLPTSAFGETGTSSRCKVSGSSAFIAGVAVFVVLRVTRLIGVSSLESFLFFDLGIGSWYVSCVSSWYSKFS